MDSIFWVISKFIWILIAPETALLFLLVLGSFLLWTRREKLGRRVITLTAVIVVVVTVLPLSDLILFPLENRFPIPKILPNQIDGIIVLAGAEDISVTSARGQPSLHSGGERLITFAWLAKRYPDAINSFEECLNLDPDHEMYFLSCIIRCYKKLGDKTKQKEYEDKYKNLDDLT